MSWKLYVLLAECFGAAESIDIFLFYVLTNVNNGELLCNKDFVNVDVVCGSITS